MEYSFVGIKARKNPFFGVSRLNRIISNFSPDVVHAHLYPALLLLLFIPGVPVVFTKHSIRLGLPRWLLPLFLFRVKKFIAICEACVSAFRESVGGKLVQIDNGVSRDRVCTIKSVPKRTVIFLFLGRLSPEKNVAMIIEAFNFLRDYDFHLNIAGEGPDRVYLADLVEGFGLNGKVSFLGNVSNPASLLSQSDVFLLSSNSEGLPISLLEAALTGLPSIVTDVGGCAEVIEKCKNGYTVKPGDTKAYAENIRKLIENPGLRGEFSRNALNSSRHYSIDRCVADHLALYRNIL